MKLSSLTLVAIVLPLAWACAQHGSSNASAPSLPVLSNSSHEATTGRLKCEAFGGLVRWFYDSYSSGPYECYGADYESWTMRAAYRSGGTETIHWMYTDDTDDPSCLKDWQWYSEDGKRLVTTIRGRTSLDACGAHCPCTAAGASWVASGRGASVDSIRHRTRCPGQPQALRGERREKERRVLHVTMNRIALCCTSKPSRQRLPALQLLTQNVQGLAKNWATVLSWFDGFRSRSGGGKFDVVILQETRATLHWASQLSDMYARAWGYDPKRLPSPLSYWPATPTAAGGVAILLHPDSAITDVIPWQQDRWSEHFVAIQGTYDGGPVTVVCVYGPTGKNKREALFNELATITMPAGLVLMGGDFNCSLDVMLDRSRRGTHARPSLGLLHLLDSWGLVDAVVDDMNAAETADDIAGFQARYHSYVYRYQGDKIATARLDRWYASDRYYDQIGKVATATPVARSDHDSVSVRIHSRVTPPRSSGRAAPQLRYPIPKCAVDAIAACSQSLITECGGQLSELPPDQSAATWDLLKEGVRRTCRVRRRECLSAATVRYRSRVKRLRRALHEARKTASPPDAAHPGPVTVENITVRLSNLALDPAARYRSIRSMLIESQVERSKRVGTLRHARHAGGMHESARAFYRRISTKFCRSAYRSLPSAPGSALGAADRVARDWRPITQRDPLDPIRQDRFFQQLPAKPAVPDLSAVDLAFSADEVARAIQDCPRGKACGPDGLGNDWYRDHAESLAPVLAPLYSAWYAAGVLPPSFAMANVFCVAKKSAPQSGLDFRPIALLNTDNKIYSRLLLQRVRSAIPKLVAETQYGFVPGRQIHDPVDIWSAFQRACRARANLLPPGSVAVFLDFAKAYDSLDRRFLSLALQRHGFSPAMVRAIDVMHLGTTAAYIADGQTSAFETVSTGIRQGCPLAPTLFILAVDILYEIVALDPRLPGLPLDGSTAVSLAGFADDTASYLSSGDEARALLSVLADFAAASGLTVNKDKSIAVRLCSSAGQADPDVAGFPLADETQLVRYLGAQVSTVPRSGQVWDLVLQQLRVRLRLAAIKTTDILQRIQVCQAVILPKITFIARHEWPSAANIRRLQRFVHNYAWHGVLGDDGVLRRAWMSAAVAAARREDGGLQVPVVRDVLMVLSANTVRRWLSAHGPTAVAVGKALAGDRLAPVAPARGPAPAPMLLRSLAATGRSVLRAAACCPRDPTEVESVLPLLRHAGRAPPSLGRWEHGWYCRDYTPHADVMAAVKRKQRESLGKLNYASLMATPVIGHGLLLHESGRDLLASDLPGLSCSQARVADLIEMQWTQPRRARFRLRGATYPYAAARSFRLLCDSLVMCYPQLLSPHDPVEYLTERGQSTDVWYLRKSHTGYRLFRDVSRHEHHDLGPVDSLDHAQLLARRATGRRRVQFAPHPWLSPALPLWGASELFSKTRLRALVASATAAGASREIAARADAAAAQSATFGAAIEQVSWQEIHQLRHSSSRQWLLFHQVKGLRLSGWDASRERRGCPHCPSDGAAAGTVFHIMWACPAAQHLWRVLRSWWATFGLWTLRDTATTRDFLSAVFSLRSPRTPPKVWDLASLSQCPQQTDAPEGPYPALQAVWQQLVLETLVVIIGWRRSRFDPERGWSATHATAIHDASCLKVLDTLAFRYSTDPRMPPLHAQLVRELRAAFGDHNPYEVCPSVSPAPLDALHLLFFDGGSRGNPGPGGSGACVIRVDTPIGSANVIWSASMSHAHKSTTNNQAEYHGLLAGLRAARRHGWAGLEVVGDSALVLRQLREYAPPKNRRLLLLYAEARRLADQLGVRQWTHHVRAYNKMADSLANLAMDTGTSSQVLHPSARCGHVDIHAYLSNDIRHWMAASIGRLVDSSFSSAFSDL